MSIAHEFDYVKARTIKEALQLLAQPGAVPLAGGTDLVAWLRDGAVSPACLVDIKALLGHESVATTQIYTNVGQARMEQVVGKL